MGLRGIAQCSQFRFMCGIFHNKNCLQEKKVRQGGQDVKGNCLGVVQNLRQDRTKSGTENNKLSKMRDKLSQEGGVSVHGVEHRFSTG